MSLFLASEFATRWTKFRDALRREDQLVWDEMWKAVDIHQDAVNAMTGSSEFEKQFVAMMIEQRRLDDEVEEKLKGTESKGPDEQPT